MVDKILVGPATRVFTVDAEDREGLIALASCFKAWRARFPTCQPIFGLIRCKNGGERIVSEKQPLPEGAGNPSISGDVIMWLWEYKGEKIITPDDQDVPQLDEFIPMNEYDEAQWEWCESHAPQSACELGEFDASLNMESCLLCDSRHEPYNAANQAV
ncbi:uncharacterized protein BO97DRAFT_418993 [Aspergillus homomorphus CBS 101889]|uniref:Uncharacterized protein n=1 Tax=Aspergillus homomorphus (strain CBS 101889) TaxID=1450537 RepID=A0A395HGT8_ASPHC|nr:hypothetical protein BO97DRAFT_418993 [Aspergillus homomorphus CBS 101889]RAL06970.1 hypothetical protein BO97DRAFT_418993 [Aspergillus homomorphus CBS 101889]